MFWDVIRRDVVAMVGGLSASDIEFNNFYYGSNIEGCWLQTNFTKWPTTFIMQCKTISKVLVTCKVRMPR